MWVPVPEAGLMPMLASRCTQGPGLQLLGPSLVFEAQCSSLSPWLTTRDNGPQACPLPAPWSGRGGQRVPGGGVIKQLPICLWAQEALLTVQSSLF